LIFSNFLYLFLFTLKAVDARDSLAKTLYEKLWQNLLQSVNKAISDESGEKQEDLSDEIECHIGVLDIFGFENFPVFFLFFSFFLSFLLF